MNSKEQTIWWQIRCHYNYTKRRMSKLAAHHTSISGIPCWVTDTAPYSFNTGIHSSFSFMLPSNKSHWSVFITSLYMCAWYEGRHLSECRWQVKAHTVRGVPVYLHILFQHHWSGYKNQAHYGYTAVCCSHYHHISNDWDEEDHFHGQRRLTWME